VIYDILQSVDARMEGKDRDYSYITRDWLLQNIPQVGLESYMARHQMHAGQNVDLEAIRPEGCTAYLCFGPITHRAAGFTLLFNIIEISEEYDNEERAEEIPALIMREMENMADARDRF
jgi:hypothetical protein